MSTRKEYDNQNGLADIEFRNTDTKLGVFFSKDAKNAGEVSMEKFENRGILTQSISKGWNAWAEKHAQNKQVDAKGCRLEFGFTLLIFDTPEKATAALTELQTLKNFGQHAKEISTLSYYGDSPLTGEHFLAIPQTCYNEFFSLLGCQPKKDAPHPLVSKLRDIHELQRAQAADNKPLVKEKWCPKKGLFSTPTPSHVQVSEDTFDEVTNTSRHLLSLNSGRKKYDEKGVLVAEHVNIPASALMDAIIVNDPQNGKNLLLNFKGSISNFIPYSLNKNADTSNNLKAPDQKNKFAFDFKDSWYSDVTAAVVLAHAIDYEDIDYEDKEHALKTINNIIAIAILGQELGKIAQQSETPENKEKPEDKEKMAKSIISSSVKTHPEAVFRYLYAVKNDPTKYSHVSSVLNIDDTIIQIQTITATPLGALQKAFDTAATELRKPNADEKTVFETIIAPELGKLAEEHPELLQSYLDVVEKSPTLDKNASEVVNAIGKDRFLTYAPEGEKKQENTTGLKRQAKIDPKLFQKSGGSTAAKPTNTSWTKAAIRKDENNQDPTNFYKH